MEKQNKLRRNRLETQRHWKTRVERPSLSFGAPLRLVVNLDPVIVAPGRARIPLVGDPCRHFPWCEGEGRELLSSIATARKRLRRQGPIRAPSGGQGELKHKEQTAMPRRFTSQRKLGVRRSSARLEETTEPRSRKRRLVSRRSSSPRSSSRARHSAAVAGDQLRPLVANDSQELAARHDGHHGRRHRLRRRPRTPRRPQPPRRTSPRPRTQRHLPMRPQPPADATAAPADSADARDDGRCAVAGTCLGCCACCGPGSAGCPAGHERTEAGRKGGACLEEDAAARCSCRS